MTNKPKIKGTKWETDNARFLRRWWPKCKRLALEGTADIGDISHPEGWAIEAKDKPYAGNLPSILREAEAEAANRGVPHFVALVKNRRSKGEDGKVPNGYAVTRTRVWADVAYRLEVGEAALAHVAALNSRLQAGSIRDSDFVVLAREALVTWQDALDRPATVGRDDG